jgi:hypothetical protein
MTGQAFLEITQLAKHVVFQSINALDNQKSSDDSLSLVRKFRVPVKRVSMHSPLVKFWP